MLIAALGGLPDAVRLRAITDLDLPFLAELYASTRLQELELVTWSEQEKSVFLEQQFRAQHQHYQQHFPNAEYLLIEQGAEQPGLPLQWRPAGRLYLDERDDEIRLIDIALMPRHRNAGLGSLLMDRVLAVADARALAVRLHVEQFNPAAGWYRRYGFELLEERGIYLFMERSSRTCHNWVQANTAS